MGSSPDDAALDWKGEAPDRTPGNEKQASSVPTFGGPTRPKKPVRRCFKPRPPLRAGCAGFASGCRLGVSRARLLSGGCPASCPDAHQPARDHRHVRNWASVRYDDSAPDHKSAFARFFRALSPVDRSRLGSVQPPLTAVGGREDDRRVIFADGQLRPSSRRCRTTSPIAPMMPLSRRILLQSLLAAAAAPALAQQNGAPAPEPVPVRGRRAPRPRTRGRALRRPPAAPAGALEPARFRRLPGHPLPPRTGAARHPAAGRSGCSCSISASSTSAR